MVLVALDGWQLPHLEVEGLWRHMAERHGNRTHPGGAYPPTPVLKTGPATRPNAAPRYKSQDGTTRPVLAYISYTPRGAVTTARFQVHTAPEAPSRSNPSATAAP